jgi:hypothetical protein
MAGLLLSRPGASVYGSTRDTMPQAAFPQPQQVTAARHCWHLVGSGQQAVKNGKSGPAHEAIPVVGFRCGFACSARDWSAREKILPVGQTRACPHSGRAPTIHAIRLGSVG